MEILITGGHGFLGSFLVDRLKKEYPEHKIITFRSAQYNLVSQIATDRLIESHRPDLVVHLAATVGGIGANKRNPGKFAYENLMMGTNILESCRVFNTKKVLTVGTICSYPSNTPVPFKEEDLFNGEPEPTNAPYGLAKKMLLTLSQSYRKQYGCNYTYVLPVNMYGPRDNFDLENSHVIPAMIRKFNQAKENKEEKVVLWGDGTPTREFLYVEDCADALVKCLFEYDKKDPMNLGSGKEISMKSLAELVGNIVGYKGQVEWDASKPNGQMRRCLDTSKAEKEINWKARTTLEEGLRKTNEWYLENKK